MRTNRVAFYVLHCITCAIELNEISRNDGQQTAAKGRGGAWRETRRRQTGYELKNIFHNIAKIAVKARNRHMKSAGLLSDRVPVPKRFGWRAAAKWQKQFCEASHGSWCARQSTGRRVQVGARWKWWEPKMPGSLSAWETFCHFMRKDGFFAGVYYANVCVCVFRLQNVFFFMHHAYLP